MRILLLSIVMTVAASSLRGGEPGAFTALVAKDAGLWPQIQLAADGSLLATGYNAPAHTTLPADVDCWASTDGGLTWAWRATAVRRPAEHANYCHWASGRAANGDSIIVVSGVDHAADTTGLRQPNDVVVFRSTDSGRTWKPDGSFPKWVDERLKPYPFGGVAIGRDNTLRMLAYTVDEAQGNVETSWMLTSRDDGRTWGDAVKIAKAINEAVAVPSGEHGWLCVARTSDRPDPEFGQELRQLRSVDDGRTWSDEGVVAEYHQHPPHLLRLTDGRLVLTYCNRRDGGILVRLSSDEGHHWTSPREIFRTGDGDRGYPSTVQLPDGRCVTVFYAKSSPLHDGYHMGAVGWTANAIGSAVE